MKINNYYKISEAARFLGVCAQTLRNWDRNGTLKAHRAFKGNYRVYKEEDLLQVLRELELQNTEAERESVGECPDCAIQIGGYHHEGCDIPRCPTCGEQRMCCECEYGPVKWLGWGNRDNVGKPPELWTHVVECKECRTIKYLTLKDRELECMICPLVLCPCGVFNKMMSVETFNSVQKGLEEAKQGKITKNARENV